MSGPRMRTTRGRQRDGAAELRPDDGAAEHAEALAAELLRHVDLPEPELLAARGQAGLDVGLELLAVERFALERDQFLVDEPPHHVAQHLQLVGKLDLHWRTRYEGPYSLMTFWAACTMSSGVA